MVFDRARVRQLDEILRGYLSQPSKQEVVLEVYVEGGDPDTATHELHHKNQRLQTKLRKYRTLVRQLKTELAWHPKSYQAST